MVTEAILFDSGNVLNRPATGHWFIPPNFYQYIDRKLFFSLTDSQRKLAFSKASEYISSHSLIRTEEEEYNHFLEYYRVFFSHLPNLKMYDKQLELITEDLVFNTDKYKFFRDATGIIPRLSTDFKLAVVSDAWPSLENVFKKAGLRQYFSSFVISSVLGVTKPNELMYKTALDELGVSPEKAIFIDDNIRNCEGARKLGIRTFLLCRDYGYFIYNRLLCKGHKVIRNLNNIMDLID